MTTPLDRWDEVKDLFGEAIDAGPDDRERLLLERAGRDEALVREVRSLLLAHDDMGERFGRPAQAILSDSRSLDGLDPVPSLEGQRLGAYVVGRKIGQGGMGAVYEAVRADDEYRQRVAIKTISRGADSGAIVRRFRRERQILAGLQHPNIAALFDGGVSEAGTPYLVMEYVDGFPIDAWCDRHHLTIPQRLDLFRQACGAVQHAHRRLVVHRDIKPGNVMVSAEGVVKLLDFGIAKLVDAEADGESLTDAGLTPLTTAYASPEQARGEPVSTATDVYSLGVVLYQLLAGAPPFAAEGRTRAQVLSAVTDEVPAAPSQACTVAAAEGCGLEKPERLSATLSGELDAIVLMALRKEPDRRYPSVDALSDDVHRYLKGLPVSARPDTAGYRIRKFVGRRRGLVIAVAVTVVAVVAGTSVAWWQSHRAALEAARTGRIADFMQSIFGAGGVTGEGTDLSPIGPRATVSALLDSAARRIPKQFPDDPTVRARLYTTIGSGLITQNRMREAADVLDSAMRLTRLTQGARGRPYAFITMLAAEAALSRNRLPEARRFTLEARHALEASGLTGTGLYSRVFLALASLALVEGDFPALDSLSRKAMDLEARRGAGPSLEKVQALQRAAAYQVIQGHLEQGDSLLLHANAMLDSLHLPFAAERLETLENLTTVSMQLNQNAIADSFARAGSLEAERALGPQSPAGAEFQTYFALLSLRRGDSVGARNHAERAVHIVDSIPDVVWPVRYMVHTYYGTILLRIGKVAEADSVNRQVVEELGGERHGVEGSEAHLRYGMTRAMLRDFPTAEAHLRTAQRLYDESGGVIPAMAVNLRYQLAQVLAREGRDAEAEKLYPTLTPAQVAAIRAFVAKERPADLAALRAAAARP